MAGAEDCTPRPSGMCTPLGAAPCCTTCTNSWDRILRPASDAEVNCPVPKTTSLPTVYANAFTAFADSAALASVCTRTLLKSAPKRGSMKLRVAASSGRAEERSTSCTIGGAAPTPAAYPDGTRCTTAAFSWQSLQLPPQEQAR